jgi:hypothetical protein
MQALKVLKIVKVQPVRSVVRIKVVINLNDAQGLLLQLNCIQEYVRTIFSGGDGGCHNYNLFESLRHAHYLRQRGGRNGAAPQNQFLQRCGPLYSSVANFDIFNVASHQRDAPNGARGEKNRPDLRNATRSVAKDGAAS